MPRPPKHVPPDTLGGRIREARESLHLSLANVAGDRYSTSLISQIERNRVEPSLESLRFLSEQLSIPLEDLKLLALQQRDAELQEQQGQTYEMLYRQTSQALQEKRFQDALQRLENLHFPHIQPALRWRIVSLRGRCYFHLRHFLDAQKDFLYALTEKPLYVPADQRLEVIALHQHLAATLRELDQPDAAFEQFQFALNMMDSGTALNYVAETHWGMSLIAFQRAKKSTCPHERESQFQLSYSHAETACTLYHAIGDSIRTALLTCHISLIQQAQGKLQDARLALRKLLLTWLPELETTANIPDCDLRRLHDLGNLVSAIACSLAGIELEAGCPNEALTYVQHAAHAGEFSNKLRQAEAEMMLGQILQTQEDKAQKAEEAFRRACSLLEDTDRLAARIRAYDLLGRHLLKTGKTVEGEKVLDHARLLSHQATAFSSTTIVVDSEHDDMAKDD